MTPENVRKMLDKLTNANTISPQEFKILNNFLLSIQADMAVIGVHGFLTAILSSPNEMTPDEWLPFVFGLNNKDKWVKMQRPLFLNDQEGKEIVGIIHRLNMQITTNLQSNDPFFPLVSLENLKLPITEAPMEDVKQWCWGYLHAVDANFKAWSSTQDVFKLLFPVALLSGTYPAEDLFKALEQPLDEASETKYCLEILPEAVKSIYRFWQLNRYSDIVKSNVLEKLRAKYNELKKH